MHNTQHSCLKHERQQISLGYRGDTDLIAELSRSRSTTIEVSVEHAFWGELWPKEGHNAQS